jgi:hypothetical protein
MYHNEVQIWFIFEEEEMSAWDQIPVPFSVDTVYSNIKNEDN